MIPIDHLATEDWLATFPYSWVDNISTNKFLPIYTLKRCILIHKKYTSNKLDVLDEEFLFISPSLALLCTDSGFLGSKVSRGTFLKDELDCFTLEKDPWSNCNRIISGMNHKLFLSSKLDYGHVLLDYLPQILTATSNINLGQFELYTGCLDNSYAEEGLKLCAEGTNINIISKSIPPIHNNLSYAIYEVKNLILPPCLTRLKKIHILKKYFLPRLENQLAIKKNETMTIRSSKIFINREEDPLFHVLPNLKQLILKKGYRFIDFTKKSIFEAYCYIVNSEHVIVPLGAETANLIFAKNTIITILLDSSSMDDFDYLSSIYDSVLTLTNQYPLLQICDPLDISLDDHKNAAGTKLYLDRISLIN